MKVTIEKPEIITLLYKQEKTDEDYGSCLWGRFYLDLKNYTMSIESDCGNYSHGWVPTPEHESFLQLLARMDKDYLLGKISSEFVIDGDATAEAITEFVKACAEAEDIELDSFDLERIHDACFNHNIIYALVDDVLDEIDSAELRCVLEQESYELYNSVVTDYPADAKKIASVFDSCIRPKIKEIIKEQEATAACDAPFWEKATIVCIDTPEG